MSNETRADWKDRLIAYKSFGKQIDSREEYELTEKIAEATTFENILVYDRIGATPLEMAQDFDPIIRGDLDAWLSPRFRVINRPYNETSMDYIKLAVGCAVKDADGRILWLRRKTPDLYGKTITGVSGHVAYEDKDEWNNHRHNVYELFKVIDENMYKEFCEELGVRNEAYNEDFPQNIFSYSSINAPFNNPYESTGWGIPSNEPEMSHPIHTFTCYMNTCKHPLYLNTAYSRKLVLNTDIYGNEPYMTFMYSAYIRDNETFSKLVSGEPDKHTLEYGTLDDLLKLRKDCTTLLPQLLKAYND